MKEYPYYSESNGLSPLEHGEQSTGIAIGSRHALELNVHQIDNFILERSEKQKPQSRYAQVKNIFGKISNGDAHHLLSQKELRPISVAINEIVQYAAVVDQHQHLKIFTKELRIAFFKDGFYDIPGGHTPGRDFLFQYYCSARLKASGCTVSEGEPDIVCGVNDLTFGVAAKRCTVKNLEARLRDGARQIIKSGYPGIICIDLSQDSPFRSHVGTYSSEQYVHLCNKWMWKNFMGRLEHLLPRLNIRPHEVPIVVGFHIATHCDREGHLSTRQLMAVFRNDPPYIDLTPQQLQQKAMLLRVVEAMRRTLPGC